MATKLRMYSVTHEIVTVPVGRDRKIHTALKTNQTARFVTAPSEKKEKKMCSITSEIQTLLSVSLKSSVKQNLGSKSGLENTFTSVKLTSVKNFYKSRKLKVNCSFTVHIFHLLAVLKAH